MKPMWARAALYSALLIGLCWFQFGQDGSAFAVSQRAADLFEQRPTTTLLIVGNSRTFYNDMPSMLRRLANSRDSRSTIEVETATAPGASFQDHWSDSKTKRLLAAGWDEVILQGESRAQSSREQNELFQSYGEKLATIAQVNGGRPTLLANWPYDPEHFRDYPAYDRPQQLAWVHHIHYRLARDAQTKLLNLADLWETVRTDHPELKLTVDGNHPSLAGSYLYALAVYTFVTNEPVGRLSYAPDGLAPADAATLRTEVDAFSFRRLRGWTAG